MSIGLQHSARAGGGGMMYLPGWNWYDLIIARLMYLSDEYKKWCDNQVYWFEK